MSAPAPPDRDLRILTAASRLIAHYGYEKTTMDDIAREAGVSKGAIYLHWPSKSELFAVLIEYEMQRMLDDVLSRVEADPQGGTIPRMYTHALLALQDNALMRTLYIRDSRILGDYIRHHGPGRYTQRLLFGKIFVERMQAAGLLRRDVYADAMAYILSAIAYGFTGIEAVIPASQAPALDEIGKALTALVESGFAAPEGNSQAGKQALADMVAALKEQYQSAPRPNAGVKGKEG